MGKRRNGYTSILVIGLTLLTAGAVFLRSRAVNYNVSVESNQTLEAKEPEPGETETVEVISPDEKFTLIMENEAKVNGITTQTFFVKDEKDGKTVEIYSTEVGSDSRVTVPFNTFSPDNKHLFLISREAEDTKYLVLRMDGKEIKDGEQFIEVAGLFNEKYPDFVITDVTGWGGYSLLVNNTDTADGKTGPSWWFDLSNFSFIKLGTRFN